MMYPPFAMHMENVKGTHVSQCKWKFVEILTLHTYEKTTTVM